MKIGFIGNGYEYLMLVVNSTTITASADCCVNKYYIFFEAESIQLFIYCWCFSKDLLHRNLSEWVEVSV